MTQETTVIQEKEPLLQVRNIVKTFGIVKALSDVSFDLYPGEILGLIGENGSGKSTVSSIIAGMQKADSGEIFFQGKPWSASSMVDALDKGIGMIVQETGTIPGISVAENVFLGEIERFRVSHFPFAPLNKKKMNQEAEKILSLVDLHDISGSLMTGALDFVTRKLIEIAKVISKNPSIMIVDETSTALNQTGRQTLYRLMKEYRNAGKAVIFISHDLDEVIEQCDRLIVLRDGHFIQDLPKKDFSEDGIKKLMVGRSVAGDYYRSDYDGSFDPEVVMELKDASIPGSLDHVSLQIHKGEILGISGLSHCGMHTLGKVLFGARQLSDSEYLLHGKTVKNEANAMREKVGYVAKDRDTESLNLNASVSDNIAIAGLNSFSRGNFLVLYPDEKKYVNEQIDELQIKCFDRSQFVSTLSGGNKQKVVFGKWVGCGSEILILDCPTRGVDIGVKQFMYHIMYQLKKEGKTLVLISEELPELLGMSDRLIVMKDGKIQKEFPRSKDLRDVDVINYMI